MRYGIIGDIHANYEALTATLAECEKLNVEKYFCIGDIVGYNADPGLCMETIQALPLAGVVMGNHDEQASTDSDLGGFNPKAAMAIEWTREHLTEEQRKWLRKRIRMGVPRRILPKQRRREE